MASYAGPNLAMTTSTRIETAAKHHQQVRVNYELMLSWVGFDQMTLRRDKHKYAMHKDDVVIGCARPLRNNEPPRHTARNRAYPSVVATLAKMELPAINYLVALYHNTRTFRDRDEFINNVECNMDAWCGPGSTELARKQIQEMPEFYFVGVSVGVAFAHPDSGDDMATAMIGGLATVKNGAFPVCANDEIHWYWDAERDCFDSEGRRITQLIEGPSRGFPSSDDVSTFLRNHHFDLCARDEKRRKFLDRGNGTFVPPSYRAPAEGKTAMACLKPLKYNVDREAAYDKRRCIGRALGPAAPYEWFDVRIQRQSH